MSSRPNETIEDMFQAIIDSATLLIEAIEGHDTAEATEKPVTEMQTTKPSVKSSSRQIAPAARKQEQGPPVPSRLPPKKW